MYVCMYVCMYVYKIVRRLNHVKHILWRYCHTHNRGTEGGHYPVEP